MKRVCSSILLVFCVAGARPAFAADFDLTNSGLILGIFGQGSDNAISHFSPTALPFANSHSLQRGMSFVSASYDYSQTRLLTEVMLDSEHGSSPARTSIAEQRLYVHPVEDLFVQYAGRFDFDLPAVGMEATLSFGVYDPNVVLPDIHVVQHTHYSILGLGAGSFEVSGEFVIPATQTWYFRSFFDIRADTAALAAVGTGSGYLDIRFVPEPATLTLLVAVFAILRLPLRQRVCAKNW